MSDLVQGVEFGELPEKPPRTGHKRGPSKEWIEVAEQLKAKPDRWAKVRHKKVTDNKSAHGVAVRMRNGSLVAFAPAGSFKVEVRGSEVWACYVGESTEQDSQEPDSTEEDTSSENGTSNEQASNDGQPVVTF